NPIAEAMGAAEDIPDPLDGLVEECAVDPGAAFAPEVLKRLATLKKEDRAAFEVLRSKLKKAGCRIAALDEVIAEENWPIRAKGFRRWLARRFYEATGGAPSSQAQSALNVIEAIAHFDGPQRVVHVSVTGLDGRLRLDLGDETWRAVEFDATGWRVIDNP